MSLQFGTETLTFIGHTTIGIMQWGTVTISTVAGNPLCRDFVGGVYVHTLAKLVQHIDQQYVGGVYVHVLASRTPIFEWSDVLQYEIFPTDIGYNSVGATRFATDVVVVDSGADQRTSRWDQPLMEYDVTYGVRTIAQLQNLLIFFRTMRGRRDSFLYYDHLDHTSTATAFIDNTQDFPSNPLDQFIGTGDGLTKKFQLIKTYHSPNNTVQSVRQITKPIDGTVAVAIDGTVVTNYTVDRLTGLITFTPLITLSGLNNMALVYSGSGATDFQIVSPTAVFNNFSNGQQIVMNGWATGRNNTTEAFVLSITNVSGDYKTLTIHSSLATWTPESSRNGVNIYVNPAPLPAVTITAGFEFYVPVRFDTDRLPITLEEYGIGGAADVKLIEVRAGNT